MEKRKKEQKKIEVDNLSGKVGVVTVTYNSGEVLPDFLRSLDRQSEHNLMVVAVDNASQDNTLDQLRSWPTSKLSLIVNVENVGVAAGNNQGIRAALDAGCDYVLLLNNDVRFDGGLVTQLLNGLRANDCQMTIPLIYYADRPDVIWCAGGRFNWWLGYLSRHLGDGLRDEGQFSEPRSVEYAPTCCVLIRREVFEQVGMMDERYFVYSDDSDFMYRAMRAGFKMFLVPQAKLWHKVNSLTKGEYSNFSLFYGARGKALFFCKHLGRFWGSFWTLIYLTVCWVRPFLGLDSWQRSVIRRQGILNGRRIGLTRSPTSS